MTTFPADLIEAEQARQQAAADRAALARTLPWSVVPLDGFEDTQIWRPRHRPDSPGYTPEQATRMDQLTATELDHAAAVATHPWWGESGLSGPDLVAARMELKQTAAASRPASPAPDACPSGDAPEGQA